MDYYYSPHRKKGKLLRKIGHSLAVLIGSILVLFGGYKGVIASYHWALRQPVNIQETKAIIFTVEKGENVRSIGARLKEEGLIFNDIVFYIYVRSQNVGEQIKAGKFIVHKSDTIPQIVSILTGDATGEIVMTIPEGWTIKDIEQELQEKKIKQTENFITCAKDAASCGITEQTGSLEGYLFPDTYFLDPTTFSAESFTKLLLNTFTTKIKMNLANEIAQSTRSFSDVIIMASIIEKEVNTEADRAIVAGILWKRIDNDWTLGADATLLYNDDDGVITQADLEKDDPYNTRNHQGLPPTPICNPGLKAIMAALEPQESPYWFYLTDKTGKVHYAVTNDQQNENKTQYLD